jgi:hypothetical protein
VVRLEEWHFGNHSKQAYSGGEMDQSTLDTAMHHLNRLKSENRWYKWREIITLLLVRSVILIGEAAQASAITLYSPRRLTTPSVFRRYIGGPKVMSASRCPGHACTSMGTVCAAFCVTPAGGCPSRRNTHAPGHTSTWLTPAPHFPNWLGKMRIGHDL